MKRTLLLLVFAVSLACAKAQPYVPFPKDSAEWNVLFYWNGSPNPSNHWWMNTSFIMQGDTTIGAQLYSKIYHRDSPSQAYQYTGGLREDSTKHIFFYPAAAFFVAAVTYNFPSDTMEHLLYSFDSLSVGDTVHANPGNNLLIVTGIDSVLVDSQYRKVYEISNQNMLGQDHWIEGIGSVKTLFAPFTYEFEWMLDLTCYSDASTNYVNTDFFNNLYLPHTYCSYITGAPETPTNNALRIAPNPVADELRISAAERLSTLQIFDVTGKLMLSRACSSSEATIDVSLLPAGMYLLEAAAENGPVARRKFLRQ